MDYPTSRVILVAYEVNAPTMKDAQETLMRYLPTPPHEVSNGEIECWWIAEDERYDRSDNDSAVFVPMGQQLEIRDHLRDRDEFYTDWNTEPVVTYTPCLADFMAGTLCLLPAGHEGPHGEV